MASELKFATEGVSPRGGRAAARQAGSPAGVLGV